MRRTARYRVLASVAGLFVLTSASIFALDTNHSRFEALSAQVAILEDYRAGHSNNDAVYAELQKGVQREQNLARESDAAMAAYRETHSHSDLEYGALEASALRKSEALDIAQRTIQNLTDEAKEAQRVHFAYSETHGHSNAEYASLAASVEHLRQRVARVEVDLTSKRSLVLQQQKTMDTLEFDLSSEREQAERMAKESAATSRALAEVRERLMARDAWLRDSVLPIVDSLRPPKAKDLAASIVEKKSKLAEFRLREEKFRTRNVIVIDTIRLSAMERKIAQAEAEIKELEGYHGRQLEPWERAVTTLRADVDHWLSASEDAEGDKSWSRDR